MFKERETSLVRMFFLKFWYTSKVSDALVRRGTLNICTKFNVSGINFIVGRFQCMIYVMKSMVHVVKMLLHSHFSRQPATAKL